MKVTLVPVSDICAWDQAVQEAECPIPFVRSAWQEAVCAAFPLYRTENYWVLVDGRRIGGWSQFRIRPFPGLRFWEAGVWQLVGGWVPLDRAPVERTVPGAVLDAWMASAESHGVARLVWTPDPTDSGQWDQLLQQAGFRQCAEKPIHYLPLPDSPEALWESVKGSVRTDVRKARKNGVSVRQSRDDTDLNTCYRLYTQTMERLGGLAKPRSLIAQLLRSDLGRLWVAEREGRVVAGLLALVSGPRVTIWLNFSDAEGRRYAANHLLYWTALSAAIQGGCRIADFGASPPENRGLVHFKASWGAVEQRLTTYQKTLRPARARLWEAAERGLRRLYRNLPKIRE